MNDPFADPNWPLDYGEFARDVKPSQPNTQDPEPKAQTPNAPAFSIEDLVGADAYELRGVLYRGEQYSFCVAKTPLPSKTQDEHVEAALKAGDDFRAANASMVYAIAKTLYKNRDGAHAAMVEQARAVLENTVCPYARWINTLSRAIYNAQGLDEVVHDYGLPTQYSRGATLAGPECLLGAEAQTTQFVQALLDTSDTPKDAAEIFAWITGKQAYAMRFTQTIVPRIAVVVNLGAAQSLFCLSARGDLLASWPALGVRAHKDGAA